VFIVGLRGYIIELYNNDTVATGYSRRWLGTGGRDEPGWVVGLGGLGSAGS